MKYILQILIISIAYFSSSQVRITQKNEERILVQDDFYPKAEVNIKFSEHLDTLMTNQEGFHPNTDHTFPIISICENKNEIIITTFLHVDNPDVIILITINKRLNSIQFEWGKGPKKFEGKGVNVIFLKDKKLEKCKAPD